jgi:translation initiation factor IF-2
MRHRLVFAALPLLLAGCVVPPPGPAPYGYAPAGYPAPGYPVQQDFAYPGYAYNDGSPTYYDGGVTWPLVFYGGGWGYWDGYHRWHGAPGPVGGFLGRRFPGGVGYRPFGGGQFGRPAGFRGAYGPGGGFRPGFGGGSGGMRGRPAAGRAAAPVRHREQGH